MTTAFVTVCAVCAVLLILLAFQHRDGLERLRETRQTGDEGRAGAMDLLRRETERHTADLEAWRAERAEWTAERVTLLDRVQDPWSLARANAAAPAPGGVDVIPTDDDIDAEWLASAQSGVDIPDDLQPLFDEAAALASQTDAEEA